MIRSLLSSPGATKSLVHLFLFVLISVVGGVALRALLVPSRLASAAVIASDPVATPRESAFAATAPVLLYPLIVLPLLHELLAR